MADLGLADAVDATEPLLQPVRVPRQVVVDHEVRATLEVHTLTSGVVRNHHADERIGVEGSDGCATGLPRDATMDDDHRSRVAHAGGDLLLKVFQRVLWLSEDQDFAAQAGGLVEHDRVVEDRLELPPLCVLA